ncbi:MAG: pyridoxal phosphate-dependent aminotransferase [Acidobacteriota bacterium]
MTDPESRSESRIPPATTKPRGSELGEVGSPDSRRVPRADYLLWAKRRPHPTLDLARSDVPPCTLDDLPGVREALSLQGRNDEGWPPLVSAVAVRYGVEEQQVVTATGASGANFLACAALLRPGDEVIAERPGYDPMWAVPELLGARLVWLDRRFEERFSVDVDRVAALVTPRTRLVVLTSPHNPTGVAIPVDVLRELDALADRRGFHVLVDEIYADSLIDRPRPAAAALGPRLITTGSLTKTYGLSSLRCGWVLAAPDVAAEVLAARALVDGVGSVLTERAAAIAFGHLPALLARARGVLEPNRRRFEAFMEREPTLEWVEPDGGTVAFPRLVSGEDAEGLAERLLRDHETAVVPGHFFGAPAHFRVALGIDAGELGRGLVSLSRSLRVAT